MADKTSPKVYSEVPNWWYHYYSIALDKKIKQIQPGCFLLHPHKSTPDFRNYRYDYGICHFQIGKDVFPGKSIVVLKTAIGLRNAPRGFVKKSQFINGYFRVYSVDRNEQCIIMDKEDSLLLLNDPIRIDVDWAQRLFPEKNKRYWMSFDNLVRKIGSVTRNRHIKERELMLILKELHKRREEGSENYFGERYNYLRFP